MNLAQTISIRRNIDFNGVLAWRLREAESYINSQAWQDDLEYEQNRFQFLSDLVKSINQTENSAANAIVKTIAARTL